MTRENTKVGRPSKKGLSLSPEIVEAWQNLLLALGRFPKGTRKTSETPARLVYALARAERTHIMALRETFNQRRSQINRRLLAHKKDLVAYLLGFHLANAARLQFCLKRVVLRWNIRDFIGEFALIRVHDLGSGSAAMAQAWLVFLKGLGIARERMAFRLVDSNQVLLSAAADLIEGTAGGPLRVDRVKSAVEESRLEVPATDELTIISLGYLWNEINPKAREAVMRLLARLVQNKSPVLLSMIEPATQDQSRGLMALRDELVGLGFHALYPCPHSSGCPMLERSRDWCYSEFPWQRPKVQEDIDRLTEADRIALAASAYLFASPAAHARLERRIGDFATLVGRPSIKDAVPTTGHPAFEYLLCTEEAKLIKKQPPTEGPMKRRGEVFVRD